MHNYIYTPTILHDFELSYIVWPDKHQMLLNKWIFYNVIIVAANNVAVLVT